MSDSFRSPGELVICVLNEVDDDLKEKPNGVKKTLIFDKGTEKYVYTDPGHGIDHLLEVRKELYRRRTEDDNSYNKSYNAPRSNSNRW